MGGDYQYHQNTWARGEEASVGDVLGKCVRVRSTLWLGEDEDDAGPDDVVAFRAAATAATICAAALLPVAGILGKESKT